MTSFCDLPDDIVVVINSFLEARDIYRFRQVNRHYRQLLDVVIQQQLTLTKDYPLLVALAGEELLSQRTAALETELQVALPLYRLSFALECKIAIEPRVLEDNSAMLRRRQVLEELLGFSLALARRSCTLTWDLLLLALELMKKAWRKAHKQQIYSMGNLRQPLTFALTFFHHLLTSSGPNETFYFLLERCAQSDCGFLAEDLLLQFDPEVIEKVDHFCLYPVMGLWHENQGYFPEDPLWRDELTAPQIRYLESHFRPRPGPAESTCSCM